MAKSIIFLCAVLTLALIAFMFTDDHLTPEAKALLEESNPQLESNAYFFLMGIVAAPEDDPIAVGKTIYASIQAGEDNYINKKQIFSFIDYPDNKRLALPQGDMFCPRWEADCYKKIFDAATDYKSDEHKLLRERYLTFLSLDDYQTLNKPLVDAPFPPYAYTTKAFRLLMLENIQAALNGNSQQQAVTTILTLIGKLRSALEKSDNLIAKMVFSIQISEAIDTISILCGNGDCTQEIELPLLTEDEMSMESSLKREYQMGYHLLKNLEKNRNFISMETEIPQIAIPLINLFLKVNITTNVSAANFTKLINQAKLTPANFTAALKSDSKIQPSWSARNIIGYALFTTEGPDYNVFTARIHDLNLKIALLNATSGHSDIAHLSVFNPYYEKFQKPELTNGMLCMKGPLQDTRNMRCLPLSSASNSIQTAENKASAAPFGRRAAD